MCAKPMGADMVFAWPTAEIAVMGAKGAVEVISSYRKEIKEAQDPAAMKEEKIAEYERNFNVPYKAAERGFIDAVIIPHETRVRLIDALDAMGSKSEVVTPRKHGNIPL